MKLHDIRVLTEAGGNYLLYKISSPSSASVYYGYYQFSGDLNDDQAVHDAVIKQFVAASKRSDDDLRGSSAMVNSAGGTDDLKVQVIDVHTDEIDAFNERNIARAHDSASINGPSMFPAGVFARAKKETPDKVAQWDKTSVVHLPANKAMAHPDSVYDQKALFALRDTMNRHDAKELVDNLHKMSYPDFVAKYFPKGK